MDLLAQYINVNSVEVHGTISFYIGGSYLKVSLTFQEFLDVTYPREGQAAIFDSRRLMAYNNKYVARIPNAGSLKTIDLINVEHTNIGSRIDVTVEFTQTNRVTVDMHIKALKCNKSILELLDHFSGLPQTNIPEICRYVYVRPTHNITPIGQELEYKYMTDKYKYATTVRQNMDKLIHYLGFKALNLFEDTDTYFRYLCRDLVFYVLTPYLEEGVKNK